MNSYKNYDDYASFEAEVKDYRVELPDDFFRATRVTVFYNSKIIDYIGPIDYSTPVLFAIMEKYMYFRSSEVSGIPIESLRVEIEYEKYKVENRHLYKQRIIAETMNAKEARKLSQSSGGLTETETVLEAVKKNAEMGRDNFLAWGITMATVKELKKMGYVVEPGANYGEQNCFYIRW